MAEQESDSRELVPAVLQARKRQQEALQPGYLKMNISINLVAERLRPPDPNLLAEVRVEKSCGSASIDGQWTIRWGNSPPK